MINIGLVGCGRISEKHLEAIKQLNTCKLTAVCDINEERAKKAAEQTGCTYYTDYEEMLKDKNINLISVCTPSGLHPKHTIMAAKYKKHVLTEKPMALKTKDADEMIRVCKEQGVKLFVVKQNRYNPPIQKAYEALKKGRFGKLLLLNTTVRWARPQEYYDQDEWRGTKEMDGGVLMNQASHHVDLLQWFGGPVESVFAKAGTLDHDIEVDDTAIVVLKFKSGALGIIEATTCTFPKNLEGSLTILGTKGSVKVGGFAVNKIDTWDFKDYENDDELIYKHSTVPPNVYGFGHAEVYKNVAGSILNNKDQFVDGEEGRKSLELINAIYKSAEEGREVFLSEFKSK
jgi:predicted dehydrogenase